MYDIAVTVAACLRAGTRVDVAWAVQAHGFSSKDSNEALALTPGGGRVGGVLGGSADAALARAAAERGSGRLVDVSVGDVDALIAGLSCGGDARCLLVDASTLPPRLWEMLQDREPVCLVTELRDGEVVETFLYERDSVSDAGESAAAMFRRAASDTVLDGDRAITVLFPVPRLVIVGGGVIVDAVRANAELLGWRTDVVTDEGPLRDAMAGLARTDKVLVTSHDLDLSGSALALALSGHAGYIAALGSRHTQDARADWLARRGIDDISRIHGPAGLNIGAASPAEIAVSILGEAIAVAAGRAGGTLTGHDGPIRVPAAGG